MNQSHPHEHDESPGEYVLPGLEHDVEILVDKWGIPHIYAETGIDAYTAQGFQAARDRLFQIDLWRRRGLGKLAEVFGEKYVEQDRATRLFTYRGDMRTEWLSYSTTAQDIVTAFVTGINAYVRWVLDKPQDRLPPEFHHLDYHPALWQPEDILRIRTHGLFYNAEQELARALTLRDLGPAAEELRSIREPESQIDDPDPDIYEHLNDAVLDVYRLAFAPVPFEDAAGGEEPRETGSNNWVVAPSRSATGRPIVANDPHRAVTLPSLRYLAHLSAPGLNIIGAGEPNLPGISIGHNEQVAFGLTISAIDHEDLYIYELHPDDDECYRYNDAWERFETVEEHAPVRGANDAVHKLSFTRHGPVIYTDLDHRIAVAVRAVWLEPGMAPYLASLEFQRATDAPEFQRSLRRWGAPGINMVYASTEGDIGWQTSGLVPRRPGWDGSLPVPGDGRYEWDGFAAVDELPSVHNPDTGWFTSSNENNLPQGYDNDALTITRDWYSSSRHERLAPWFEDAQHIDVDSSVRMQADAYNVHARRLLDQLRDLEPQQHAQHWQTLQRWDGHESAGSFAALLYQVWQRRHFRPWLVDRCLERLNIDAASAAKGRDRLLRDDTLFSEIRPDMRMIALFDTGNDADRAALTEGVETTLGTALAEIQERLGDDQANWTWGALHQTTLRHPVLSQADVPEAWGTLPSVPQPGSGDTVGLRGYDTEFNAVMGSSFRMVTDVGDWDQTQVMNAPGQSGDPRSKHYADLLDLWAADDSFPLLYSRDAIEDSLDTRIVLRADPDHSSTEGA